MRETIYDRAIMERVSERSKVIFAMFFPAYVVSVYFINVKLFVRSFRKYLDSCELEKANSYETIWAHFLTDTSPYGIS